MSCRHTIADRRIGAFLAALLATLGILTAWQGFVMLSGVPAFILPTPLAVADTLLTHRSHLLLHSLVTASEILLGLMFGCLLGIGSALWLIVWQGAQRWALPLMIISQSLPVFAIAPLLTLWFGYGMASKVVMATLIIYFPVVAASFDGLRRTCPSLLDLAHTLNATPQAVLLRIRLPAALPSIASGIRVAASVAPIGAVVGEWVGSSQGLGYLMLQANGRMQTDRMFAALVCLCLLALLIYFLVSHALERCLYWQQDSTRLTPRQTNAT